MKVWSKGIIRDEPVPINSLNYGLHYASPCIWEGIRAYTQADGTTRIFKLDQHIDRLFDSAKIIGIDIPSTKAELRQACLDVVAACGGGELYLRPVVYSDLLAESAKPQTQSMAVDIYCFPIKPLHSDKKGVKVAISTFKRGYPQFQMQAKTAGNYSILQNAKHELVNAGMDDVLLTDNDGYITEATVANIWVFKNGVAMTPPNDGSILPGITRRTVSDMIRNYNMKNYMMGKEIHITEKRITRADLYTADCVILCGTYAEIVNVSEIDGRKISEDHWFFEMLKSEYGKTVRGIK
jgi:branched-chain amino acid aminotransferase